MVIPWRGVSIPWRGVASIPKMSALEKFDKCVQAASKHVQLYVMVLVTVVAVVVFCCCFRFLRVSSQLFLIV